jgi:hypothetical protein
MCRDISWSLPVFDFSHTVLVCNPAVMYVPVDPPETGDVVGAVATSLVAVKVPSGAAA